MEVQWFPGHMAKAIRETREKLKLVDMVIEVRDARLPYSSSNPVLADILVNKRSLIVLNKSDLADRDKTRDWLEHLKAQGNNVLAIKGTDRSSVKQIISTSNHICQDLIDKARQRGQVARPIRAMILGIPNTGKSSIINSLAGKRSAKVSNRPGVTRALQWIRAGNYMELMDTPGILWPKIDEERSQIILAASGAIKDTILDIETIAYRTLEILYELYPQALEDRYKLDTAIELSWEYYGEIAKKSGCVISGGRPDYLRFSNLILDDLRKGALGYITLESPVDED